MQLDSSQKISKVIANYRLGTSTQYCGNCVMFHHGTCDLVEGQIANSYWCTFWAPKGH